MVSKKALDMVVQVFDKAQQQGKVRFLGISAHNPKVFRRVLNEYPAVLGDHLPVPLPDAGARRRQPARAGAARRTSA